MLIAAISHDLNEHLTILQTTSSMLAEEFPPHPLLREMQNALDRLSVKAVNLLDFSSKLGAIPSVSAIDNILDHLNYMDQHNQASVDRP